MPITTLYSVKCYILCSFSSFVGFFSFI
uniref:Uncharacterized protein n=1 Tax=Anguilla anguilla TaxID=7936 RepID=A0A0E9PYU3_ANGAN